MRVSARVAVLAVALTLVVPPTGEGVAAKKKKGAKRPNILIFMTDDQRLDTLQVMPSVRKWFGQHGTTYSNAFVSNPLCCPSRGSLMTGRYPHNHGVVDNYTASSLVQRSTVQSILRQRGYQTAIVGKYMNGWKFKQPPPYFDRWAIQRSGYFGAKWSIDGKTRRIARYSTDFTSVRARKYLRFFEKKDQKPWLMWVNPNAPHDPFQAAPRHANSPVPPWDMSPAVGEEDEGDKPSWVDDADLDAAGGESLRTAQLRTLMSVDQMVDRVMRSLGQLREQRRTLAIFVSDNGFFWAEHGLWDKRLPYTEAVQVPMMMRWPGRVAKGATDSRLASLNDIVPTVLQAAGLSPRPFFPPDGRSLFAPGTRDHVFIESFRDKLATYPPWASIRTNAVQYVEYYEDDLETISFREYYDLVNDPYQLDNLLEDGDPFNDPPDEELDELSELAAHGRRCFGTTGPNACP